MSNAVALLRAEPRLRLFFAALAQSSLGTGAGYVALVVLAYDRFGSAWGVSLVLLADFAPALVLGPVVGAAVDRWSRRRCAIAADCIRAGAFAAMVVIPGDASLLVFALIAGTGTALFRPAMLASLRTLASAERAPAATALYGVLNDASYMIGPAVAAGALVLVGAESLLLLNAATFALSAAALARVPFGSVSRDIDGPRRSFVAEAREGLRSLASMPAVRILVATSGGAMFFGGFVNVVELPFAKEELGTTASGYAALVAVFGCGFVAGSLRGGSGGFASRLKARYLTGLAIMGVSGLVAAAVPIYAVCLSAFLLAGFGNGLALAQERLLLQSEVADRLHGRVFALTESVVALGIASAYVSAGAVIEALGPQLVLALTGVGELLMAAIAAVALRRHWVARDIGPHEPAAVGGR